MKFKTGKTESYFKPSFGRPVFKNILYFELYEKDKVLTKNPIHTTTNCFFFYSSKYNVISTKILHEYSGYFLDKCEFSNLYIQPLYLFSTSVIK
jgi:hypothetical protein